jgi:hypothetical protein
MKFAVLLLALTSAPLAFADDQPFREEAPDPIRFRGGFGLHGGIGLFALPGASVPPGPAISLSARLGIQFNNYFSLMYQQMPQVFFLATDTGALAMFADYNSLLVNVTLFNTMEIGAGPSFDYVAIGGLSEAGATTATGTGFGVHGRVAFVIGGEPSSSGRRSGFTLGLDLHPFFFDGGNLFMITAGVGADWF